MKKFRQYLEEVGATIDSNVDSGSNSSPNPTLPNEEGIAAAAKIAFKKYKDETEKFFNELSAKDPEIAHALSGKGATDDQDEDDAIVRPPAEDHGLGSDTSSIG